MGIQTPTSISYEVEIWSVLSLAKRFEHDNYLASSRPSYLIINSNLSTTATSR